MHITHYDWEDIIGRQIGLEGTSIVGLMLGDQLHPPMVEAKEIWKSGKRWKEGAEMCVHRLAAMMQIHANDLILDVGCGIGGPARLLASEYGCRIVGINTSKKQLKTAIRVTKEKNLEDRVKYVGANAETLPFPVGCFDKVWTMNMFYHIRDKGLAVNEFYRVLKPNGVLAFDDWTITDTTTKKEIALLKHDWLNQNWITENELMLLLKNNHFSIENVSDYSHVGKTVMKKYFGKVFNRDFRKRIEKIDPQWGEMIADHFEGAIKRTIEYYKEAKMKYIQLTATK